MVCRSTFPGWGGGGGGGEGREGRRGEITGNLCPSLYQASCSNSHIFLFLPKLFFPFPSSFVFSSFHEDQTFCECFREVVIRKPMWCSVVDHEGWIYVESGFGVGSLQLALPYPRHRHPVNLIWSNAGQCWRNSSFLFLRKKGSKTKKRMKEEEIEKGDCGPPTRKVFFFWDFVGLEPSYLITSQRVRMVWWCIRQTRLTLVCEVIRYRLVQNLIKNK